MSELKMELSSIERVNMEKQAASTNQQLQQHREASKHMQMQNQQQNVQHSQQSPQQLQFLQQQHQQQQQQVSTHSSHLSKSGSSRKSREGRSRSQEWPDVPDVGKIQEKNPELLAQKILETGRQIEAGRLPTRPITTTTTMNTNSRTRLPQATLNFSTTPPNMPPQSAIRDQNNRSMQEPPRVANFEDRLKSIITSVLNEDQQNRSKQQQIQHLPMQGALMPGEPERKRHALAQGVNAPDYSQVRLDFFNFFEQC